MVARHLWLQTWNPPQTSLSQMAGAYYDVILRLDEDRLLRKVVIAMEKSYRKGSIMMGAPRHDTMEDLIYLAGDHGYENHTSIKGMVSICFRIRQNFCRVSGIRTHMR